MEDMQYSVAQTSSSLTVAGVVQGVQTLTTGLHTLALVEKKPTWTQGAVGH